MRSHSDHTDSYVHPVRLLAAADAILLAETRPGRGSGTVTMWTDPNAPAKEGYTPVELIEAYMFLCRLGLLEEKEAKRA